MYVDCCLGELIFRLRSDLHMTQEKVSEGICTAGTISRIENGSQEPTAPMFQRLLERLGEPGFFRGFYQNKFFLHNQEIKRNILECYEKNDFFGFESAVNELGERIKPSDVASVQFLRIMELIYYHKHTQVPNVSIGDIESVMSLSHKNFNVNMDFAGFLFDYTELLILNHLACIMCESMDLDRAKNILTFMARSLDKNRHFLPSYWKLKAGIYNNLAICETLRGNAKGAFLGIQKACNSNSMEGGIYFFMKLIRTRAKISRKLNNEAQSVRDTQLIKLCFKELSEEIRRNICLREFMQESCFLEVF